MLISHKNMFNIHKIVFSNFNPIVRYTANDSSPEVNHVSLEFSVINSTHSQYSYYYCINLSPKKDDEMIRMLFFLVIWPKIDDFCLLSCAFLCFECRTDCRLWQPSKLLIIMLCPTWEKKLNTIYHI